LSVAASRNARSVHLDVAIADDRRLAVGRPLEVCGELIGRAADRLRPDHREPKSVELAGADHIGTNIGILRVAAIWRGNTNQLRLPRSKGDISTAP